MFYGVKPQSVKTPVAAKPSGISPTDRRCQCLIVILCKLQYKHKSFYHCRPPLKTTKTHMLY